MSGSANTAGPTVHGVLLEVADQSITLGIPGTDYRLSLAVKAKPDYAVGARVAGQIRATARRVDIIRSGGRYVEPVYGRPRRLQGRVTAVDAAHNTLTVYCGAPFTCSLALEQKATKFEVGQLVSFDVERGASIEFDAHSH
jgi:hypothetical protein